ncbi:MAG: phasin family protein, partial [Pseudomonadota bacterium]
MSTTRKTKAAAADATQTAQAAMNDGIERMTQGMSKFGSFGQENVEAMMECATTVAKGVEKIAAENVEYAKSQMDAGSDKFQALSKARTPQEF